MPLPTLWRLAQAWYRGRMSPTWRPRAIEESQRLLTDTGLVGPFWSLS